MSIKYALLSLLSGRDSTGYEVSRHFGKSVGHVWEAPESQIYPELNRLAQQGLLEVDELPDGARGTKKRYRVTAAGLDELQDWIESPTARRRQRDPIYLKAAYLEWADPAQVRTIMQDHLDHNAERLDVLRRTREMLLEGTHPTLAQRMERYPADQHEKILAWKVFAYDRLIEQASEEIAWAKRGMELADRFEGTAPLRDRPASGDRDERPPST